MEGINKLRSVDYTRTTHKNNNKNNTFFGTRMRLLENAAKRIPNNVLFLYLLPEIAFISSFKQEQKQNSTKRIFRN